MNIFSSLHDPKKERYAVLYTTTLIIVMIIVILQANDIFEIGPIEGSMIFFEGFVALVMLSRHEKVSHSFPNHISQINLTLKKCYNSISKMRFE